MSCSAGARAATLRDVQGAAGACQRSTTLHRQHALCTVAPACCRVLCCPPCAVRGILRWRLAFLLSAASSSGDRSTSTGRGMLSIACWQPLRDPAPRTAPPVVQAEPSLHPYQHGQREARVERAQAARCSRSSARSWQRLAPAPRPALRCRRDGSRLPSCSPTRRRRSRPTHAHHHQRRVNRSLPGPEVRRTERGAITSSGLRAR